MRFLQIFVGIMCLALSLSKDSSQSLDSDSESSESVESEDSIEAETEVETEYKTAKEQKTSSKSCRGPDIRKGVCKHLEDCDELLQSFRCPINDETMNFIKASKEICEAHQSHGVCCPIATSAPQHTSRAKQLIASTESCGRVHIGRRFTKIVGGRNSEIGAWPWLALIGYKFDNEAEFLCAGALITHRHVITSAHCLNNDLTFVRLGEFDTSNDTETNHVDINVVKKVPHEDFEYDNGRNDLAMLYLEKSVTFTEYISPICLPVSSELRYKSYVGSKPFVAGWGYLNENGPDSKILQELQTSVLDNTVCKKSFEAVDLLRSEDQFDSSILCVGDLKGGKDTCQGDSGGPLMMPVLNDDTMQFVLIGVISYGIGCARKGMAGASTNVPHHMDWIIKRLNESKSYANT